MLKKLSSPEQTFAFWKALLMFLILGKEILEMVPQYHAVSVA